MRVIIEFAHPKDRLINFIPNNFVSTKGTHGAFDGRRIKIFVLGEPFGPRWIRSLRLFTWFAGLFARRTSRVLFSFFHLEMTNQIDASDSYPT